MNDTLRKTSFSLLYYRFKETPYYSFTIFFFVFLTALFLTIYAVFPQIQSVFSLTEEIRASQNRINVLKANINFLNTLNDAALDDDLSVTFTALPSGKDFVGIVTAINNSAARSGVTLDEYSLAIGELATPSAGLETFFPLSVELTVKGNRETITSFLQNTQEALPISEIDSIETDLSEATINYIFFFKVYKQENYNVARPIASIGAADMRTLRTVREWKEKNVISTNESDLVSSESGALIEPF
jgi:hypothetical protein